ncbi:hypothetical protein BDW67DRAFT_181919 [Aspergillus spinulosporus]
MVSESVSAVINVSRLLSKWIDDYLERKKLLRGESKLEHLIKALKYFMDKSEGVYVPDDASEEWKALYILLKNEVTTLYHKIDQMKDDYQKHPRLSSIRALIINTGLYKAFRSALEAVEEFQRVQIFIYHSINPKPSTINAEQLTCSIRDAVRAEIRASIPALTRTSSRVNKRIREVNAETVGATTTGRDSATVAVGAAGDMGILCRFVGGNLPAILVGKPAI